MHGLRIDLIWGQLGYFAVGALYTIGLTLISMTLGMLVGFVICLGRMAKNKIMWAFASSYVDIMRGIPFLVFLIWFYYGLSILINYSFSPLFGGILCLSLKYSGYLAEVFRAGIQAIEKGQSEAAFSVGYSKLQTLRYIVMPQALRIVFPALGNYFVGMLQDSSVVSLVGIWELMRRGNAMANILLIPFEIYSTVGIFYLVMTVCISRINRRLENYTKL
jgi:polar amino acid transport system permease protein